MIYSIIFFKENITIKVKKKIIKRLKISTRPAFYNTLKFKSFTSILSFFLPKHNLRAFIIVFPIVGEEVLWGEVDSTRKVQAAMEAHWLRA